MRNVISASRRTDIPAFYSEWLLNRLRAGYCTVPNPLNVNQVSRVSLTPRAVDAIVFWTRNPGPLLPRLAEVDRQGYRYYFQFTLNGYPRILEPHAPAVEDALCAFRELSSLIGPDRCLWRYDPILVSTITDVDYHLRRLDALVASLAGHTTRVTVSLVDRYRKTDRRLARLQERGLALVDPARHPEPYHRIVRHAADLARSAGITIVSCAERGALAGLGVARGKCIDEAVLLRALGVRVAPSKDPAQRPDCDCIASRDIGMFDTCLHGCEYCYATSNTELAHRRYAEHRPDSPCLVGWLDADPRRKEPPGVRELPLSGDE